MRLPIQAIPYLRLAQGVLRAPGSLESFAKQKDILCPQIHETLRPAVFLPGQLERVTGTSTHFSVEDAIRLAISKTITHSPTIAYHFENVVLFDGSIYTRSHKHLIADKTLFDGAHRQTKHLERCSLASSPMGSKYFGHWLRDDCTLYLLAETMAPPLCLRRPAFDHQQAYWRYFNQTWMATDRAFIDHLILFQDFAHNASKQSRYRTLRQRLGAHFQKKQASRRFIYLRRGSEGRARAVENETEILNALAKEGFTVLDVRADALQDIIEALMSAEVVVSIEGSHISHCAFACPESCALLVLQPPDRFSANHRAWSESLGMTFGFVVGARGANGYRFSPTEILHTVEMLKNT